MWPFTTSEKVTLVFPIVLHEGIRIAYDPKEKYWEYIFHDINFVYHGNEFDLRIMQLNQQILDTIKGLKTEIYQTIKTHLEGWVQWDGEPHIVCITVENCLQDGKIDISYCGDESWGDLGVNIVIREGKIVDSYSGD